MFGKPIFCAIINESVMKCYKNCFLHFHIGNIKKKWAINLICKRSIYFSCLLTRQAGATFNSYSQSLKRRTRSLIKLMKFLQRVIHCNNYWRGRRRLIYATCRCHPVLWKWRYWTVCREQHFLRWSIVLKHRKFNSQFVTVGNLKFGHAF